MRSSINLGYWFHLYKIISIKYGCDMKDFLPIKYVKIWGVTRGVQFTIFP